MFRFFILLFSFIFLIGINQNAYCIDKVKIKGDWKFQYGDDQTWSQVNIDDSNWLSVKVPSLIKQLHKTPITGWYRIHFDAEVDINEQQALLIEYIRHSDETWINGIRVGGEGIFEALWSFKETNPVGLVRVYELPAGFLKAKNNILAIKVGIGFGNAWGAMFPGGAGILLGDVYLGDANELKEYKQQAIIKTVSFDVFILTLGLIDLLIILFLLKNTLSVFPEYKWLLLTSSIMLLAEFGHDYFYIMGFQSIRGNFLIVIALLCIPASVAIYFWSLYRSIKIYYVKIFISIWALSSVLFLMPFVSTEIKVFNWYVWAILATLFFVYSLYCAVIGIFTKRVGALAQFMGLIIFLIMIRTQWLPDNLLGHRNVQIGSLFYRYALLFAYFQQIKHMQLNYKALSWRVVKIADDIYSNLARELHDGIGQHLASMKLQAKLAIMQNSNPHLLNIEKELINSVSGLRRLLAGLHPVLVDKHKLSEALIRESNHLEKTHGIKINLNFDTLTHIESNKAIEHQLFRIFQECVHNATRHGHASIIDVQLLQKENQILFNIQDNGIGFDSNKKSSITDRGGLGLISLHERIVLMNGKINIVSKKDKGTSIRIIIPFTYNLNSKELNTN